MGAWMPVLAPELITEFGRQGRPFSQMLTSLPEPDPRLHAQLVFQSLLAMQEKQLPPSGIAQMSQALVSPEASLQMLAMLAPGRREVGYGALPPYAKTSVKEGVAQRKRLKP